VATLHATGADGPVSFKAHIDSSNIRTSRLIHILAARRRIRDLEERDIEDESIRSEIFKLATTYSLASRYTSFVAIEIQPETKKRFNLHSSSEFLPFFKDQPQQPSQQPPQQPPPKETLPPPATEHSGQPLRIQIPTQPPNPILISPSPSRSKKVYDADFLMKFRMVRFSFWFCFFFF
jgi:hypothetical protein